MAIPGRHRDILTSTAAVKSPPRQWNRTPPPDGTATPAVRPAPVRQFGSNTLSTTWITPLL